jgi:hypothetical protein
MTTSAPATETSRTVSAQDIRVYPLGGPSGLEGGPVGGLGNVVATYVVAQPCPTPYLNLTVTGFSLTTDTPSTVLIQARQSANQDFGYMDEFAVQVVTTSASALLLRIRRLDSDSGWGQDLRLDIFIVDDVANP